jgi:hypothetical protein
MLLSPLGVEFGWGEIPQRGLGSLVDIHIIQEAPDLLVSVMIAKISRRFTS